MCFRFTDTICHESDLREALRLSRIGREHWQPFLDVMMLFLGQQLRRHPTLIVRDEHGQQWTCGAGDPTTLLRADGYELLRASYAGGRDARSPHGTGRPRRTRGWSTALGFSDHAPMTSPSRFPDAQSPGGGAAHTSREGVDPMRAVRRWFI